MAKMDRQPRVQGIEKKRAGTILTQMEWDPPEMPPRKTLRRVTLMTLDISSL